MAANDYKHQPKTEFDPIDELSRDEAQQQIDALREAIEYHDRRYYVENAPEISDAAYDSLFKRLKDLEDAFPEFDQSNSPTRRVGAEPLEELQRVEHTAPMLSLNAVFEPEDMNSFVELLRTHAADDSVSVVAEPKFDGISVEVVYNKGAYERGVTRGDGQTGEDISENLRTVRSLPLKLRSQAPVPDKLAVRGEVILPKAAFQEFNRQRVERGDEPFANPRNAAAGTVRRLDPAEVAKRPLDIVFYDILEIQQDDAQRSGSHWEELERLDQWGLKTDPNNRLCSTIDEITRYHQHMIDERDSLDYEIDGIVLKADDLQLWEQLGNRDRSPRWALAWKFAPRQEVTRIEQIVVQVGMTGMLTPVALLQPVNVGGVTVSRATLHNEDEVHRKDLRQGDTVRIARAGDVIPEVIERVKRPGRKRRAAFSMPDRCPACGESVVREGAYYFCPNGLSCPPQLTGHLAHFGSQEAMDIDGLGEKTARELVEKNLVGNLADLYRMSAGDLSRLETFAQKKAEKLHDAIQHAKQPRLDRFLYALGIRHVGRRVARILGEELGSLEAVRTADEHRLRQLPDVGPEIAQSVAEFFQNRAARETLKQFKQAGVEVQPISTRGKRRPLEGKTVVITGKLSRFSRDTAKDRIESLGGRAASSVSSQTDYLVVGEAPGSKVDEARRRNVPTVDEAEFEQMLDA